MCDRRSHTAAGGGQSHFHFYARSTAVFFHQSTIVDEAKIDDVDRNLRVITLPELIPDVFLCNFAIGGCRFLRLLRLRFFQTESIQIFLCHSRKALISRDRITTPKALRNYALGSRRNG